MTALTLPLTDTMPTTVTARNGGRTKALRAPFTYFGGKGMMVGKLLRLLPSHRQYCEPFLGSGAVLFAKEPCEHETVNDVDGDVMAFFAQLRDNGAWFHERAAMTPHHEAEFKEARDTWATEPDPRERAWKWWIVAARVFSGRLEGTSTAESHTRTCVGRGMPGGVSRWRSRCDLLQAFVDRLLRVQFLCGDFERALRCTDTPDCLHFLDPPYVLETRRAHHGYAHEMTLADHERLVRWLRDEMQGKAVVCGYRHEVYAPLEQASWVRKDFATDCSAAGRTQATGILGEGEGMRMQGRVESVWLCPRTAREVGA